MNLSWINVLFSVTKIFFLLLSLSYVIVSVAFDLVALIGLLKYWVLQTDWVWLCQEIWSSVAWLYSKASDCPSFLQSLGKLNDICEMPQDIIMQSQEELSKTMQTWSYFFFFNLHFLRNEMPLYLSWNINHTSTPNFKIFPWPTGPKVLLIIMVLEKISWNSKECSFWFSVFLFKVTPYNQHSDKATSQEKSQVRSHMQLAALDFLFFKSWLWTYLEECIIIQKRTETWNYQENTLIYKGGKIKYIYLLLKTIE